MWGVYVAWGIIGPHSVAGELGGGAIFDEARTGDACTGCRCWCLVCIPVSILLPGAELSVAVREFVLSIPNDLPPSGCTCLVSRDGCDEKHGDGAGRLLEARVIGLSLTEDVVDTALITRLTPVFRAAAISADREERSERLEAESGLDVMSSSAAQAPLSQASVLASRLDTAETSWAFCDCVSRSSSAETVPSRCSVLPSAHVVLCSTAATHSSSLTVETAL